MISYSDSIKFEVICSKYYYKSDKVLILEIEQLDHALFQKLETRLIKKFESCDIHRSYLENNKLKLSIDHKYTNLSKHLELEIILFAFIKNNMIEIRAKLRNIIPKLGIHYIKLNKHPYKTKTITKQIMKFIS